MPQLTVQMPRLKIPCAATKTQHSQINKYFLKRNDRVVSYLPLQFKPELRSRDNTSRPEEIRLYWGRTTATALNFPHV